ncbi:hypothetical protein T492DRAFT_862307 [Pavlovales sp. CCMP2436]|nr:hypothetical protein T492DRAFT_862307 [Pavlovales sp. CCMP2436]
MSRNNRNPYARKFANVYAQVVDVAVVKTSDLQAWTLILNDALMQYGNSRFFGNVEIDGNLLAHNRAMFESPATFTHSVYLPTLTYLDGSLLEPTKVAITGCTASDSWLVETNKTGSEIQVQATAAFDPITVGSAVCNVSPKFTSLSTIDSSTVWPSASWVVSASSTKTGSAANNALDKSAATSWTSSSSSYNTNSGSGGESLTVQYPAAVVIKSFTLTNSPDALKSSRGLISLVSAQPTSLSTFKLVLADPQGTPVSTAGIAQDWDVHLCLTKGGKVANSGLYRFALGASGSLGETEVNAVRVIDSADVTNLVVRSKTDMSGTILMRGAATFGAAKFSGATTFEGPAEMMSTVLMRGAATFGGLVEMMGDLYVRGAASFVDAEFSGPTTIMGPVDLMGTLLMRGTSVFNGKVDMMGDLLVRGAAFLPTLTYLNGTLLEAPISIAITGCTTSDSWLVETDNTESEFQVQATAAFTPITPTSLSAFKLVLADPQGTPVSTAGIAQDWDVHLCLTKGGKVMHTVLRPYARKFANAYAQEAEVNAVRVIDSADVTNLVVRSKTDMSGTILMRGAATFGAAKFSGATTFEGPAEMMSTVLMRGAATFGGQVEMMGDLYVRGAASFVDAEFSGPTTIMGPVDLMGTLLMRGTSVFNGKVDMMGDLLVRGAAFLPTLTYLNGTLLEAPISIAITGCTTSDSWLVETDNTESEFQYWKDSLEDAEHIAATYRKFGVFWPAQRKVAEKRARKAKAAACAPLREAVARLETRARFTRPSASATLRMLRATGSGVLGAAVLRPRNDAGAGPSASGLAQLAPGQIPSAFQRATMTPEQLRCHFRAAAASNAWSALCPEVNDAEFQASFEAGRTRALQSAPGCVLPPHLRMPLAALQAGPRRLFCGWHMLHLLDKRKGELFEDSTQYLARVKSDVDCHRKRIVFSAVAGRLA